MKRFAKWTAFGVLTVVEVWLLTGFLPDRWQEQIYSKIWPTPAYDYTRITHPNLVGEWAFLRSYVIAVLVVLLLLNSTFIWLMWRRRNA